MHSIRANAGTVNYGLTGIIGSTIAKLHLTDSKIFPAYVGKFLQNKFVLLNNSTTGATIPHVSKDALENIMVPLPPLDEQKRIAGILDKVDGIRRKRRENIKLADAFVMKKVMLIIFQHFKILTMENNFYGACIKVLLVWQI